MRYYRQLATSLENHKKRRSIDSGVMTSSAEGSALKRDSEPEPEPQTPAPKDEPPGCIRRRRSNSYTLETPSPVLLAFMKSLQDDYGSDHNAKLSEIFAEKITVDDQQPSTSNTEQLTIEDLEIDQLTIKSSKRKLWDIDHTKNTSLQPASLPNSNFVSPIAVKRSYESDDCVSYNDILTSEDYEYIEKITLEESKVHDSLPGTPTKSHFQNDSFGKDFCLLDTSLNISRDTDAHESTFSDCSSVSLNKFIPSFDKKSTESHEAEHEAFCYFKEQLKLKHRQQLALLLEEQQREHDLLKEQFQKISRTSSYTKSASSTPVRAFSRDTFTKKPSPNKRKSPVILDTLSVQIPIPSSSAIVSPNDKKRHQAASKINAGVRGYLTRRLFKTARVVLLVQTIRDCLVTAMSLQNETNLGLSELDLQNRLLQQVIIYELIRSFFFHV